MCSEADQKRQIRLMVERAICMVQSHLACRLVEHKGHCTRYPNVATSFRGQVLLVPHRIALD